MTWINIPKNWTGKEALAVVEFLDEISAAIWKVHEPKMLDAWYVQSDSNDESEVSDQMPPDAVYVGTQTQQNQSTTSHFDFLVVQPFIAHQVSDEGQPIRPHFGQTIFPNQHVAAIRPIPLNKIEQ